MCKQFNVEGYCPYGNRCQFIHLIIQKADGKVNYSDILKESISQYENRCQLDKFSEFEDLIVNPYKESRLPIFKEFSPENDRITTKFEKNIPRIWESFGTPAKKY